MNTLQGLLCDNYDYIVLIFIECLLVTIRQIPAQYTHIIVWPSPRRITHTTFAPSMLLWFDCHPCCRATDSGSSMAAPSLLSPLPQPQPKPAIRVFYFIPNGQALKYLCNYLFTTPACMWWKLLLFIRIRLCM